MKQIYYLYKKQKKIDSVNLHSRNIINILTEQLHCSINETTDVALANHLSGDDVFFIPFECFNYKLFKVRRFSSIVFVFHNITPPKHFLWGDIPLAFYSIIGYVQLFLLSRTKASWITVSDYNAKILRKFGIRAKVCPSIVETPPNGIHETVKFDNPSVIYVGRIVQNKQCYELLEIVRKAADQLKQKITFYVVGSGKVQSAYYKGYINKIHELDNHQYLTVIWKEGLDYLELTRLYSQCWLYVTMSKHEGFGVPVCESVACGTPSLYTPCGGQETILKRNGVVNADAFSEKIVEYLLSPDKRLELLLREKEYVDTFMSPIVDNTVADVFGFYCK